LEGVDGVGMPVLGDVLLARYAGRSGVQEALLAAPCTRLLGSHLVMRGVLSAADLCAALRELSLRRIAVLLAQRDPKLDAHDGRLPLVAGLRASVPLGGAVLANLLPDGAEAGLLAVDAPGPSRLNRRGRRCVTELAELRHGARRPPLTTHAPVQAEQHILQVLRFLGLLSVDARPGRYAVLLQMRRDLSRRVPPAQLLGLDASADAGAARVRLRAMARVLHPDLFQSSAPGLVREAERVLAALTSAASAVACGSMRTA
jgi:hypothetical protein